MQNYKVTEERIESLLKNSKVHTDTVFDKVTVVNVQLPNGFVITATSGAVDESNYDLDLGYEICMKHIEDKLWELEGYALASGGKQ